MPTLQIPTSRSGLLNVPPTTAGGKSKKRLSQTSRPTTDRRWGVKFVKACSSSCIKGEKCASISSFLVLALGATGVVFGDIGTSPLYAFVGIWVGVLKTEPTVEDIVGTFSMLFWTLTWVVCFKYVSIVMRVSHHGEGGVFALMQTILSADHYHDGSITRNISTSTSVVDSDDDVVCEEISKDDEDAFHMGTDWKRSAKSRLKLRVTFLSMLGCSLIIGDGAITPVISVLSALQGTSDYLSQGWQVVLAVCILFFLFGVQRYGSHVLGMVAGPIMVCWFLSIGGIGAYNLAQNPEMARTVARGFNPFEVYRFWVMGRFHGLQAWKALAGVVLAVTGTEALYADMGHFGAGPITFAWFALIYPCLILQYMGQSTVLALNPSGVSDPFFTAVPPSLHGPMTLLATIAAILASQALISGVFSLLSQAYALELLPRILVLHTNPDERGQVYIPEVNWLLCAMCVVLCTMFRTSEALAGAYGITVTGDAVITTAMLCVVLRKVWHWSLPLVALIIVPMVTVDLLFWSANALKIFDSGWVPVLITSIACLLMHSHHWGRRREKLCLARERAVQIRQLRGGEAVDPSAPLIAPIITMQALQKLLHSGECPRIGTMGIFLTPFNWRVPRSLDTLVKTLQCLPKTILLLNLHFEPVPFVLESERVNFEVIDAKVGLYRVSMRFGYAEPLTADHFAIPSTLARIAAAQGHAHPGLLPLVQQCSSPKSISSKGSTTIAAGKVTYFLSRENHAIEHWHSCWTRLRANIYSFLVLNCRRPITIFGLEEQNTMEIAVVRFL